MSNMDRGAARAATAAMAALLFLAFSPSVRAGEQHPDRRHAVVQIVRDPNGNALRFGPRATSQESANWSGYVLPKFESKTKYTSASATWVVPSVTFLDAPAGFTDELSATWVGIGGYCKNAKCHAVDRKLIQLGTEQDAFSDGTTDYYAWYELLPAFETPIPTTTLTIHPGDTITASLSCSGKCKGKASWTLTIADLTTGQTPFTIAVKYKASKLSAEWIQEAPTFNGVIQPIADYNTMAFAQATANGATADVGAGDNLVLINLNDPTFPTSDVSAPVFTNDGFAACWGANGSFVNCPIP